MTHLFLKRITKSTKDFDEKTGLWLFYSLAEKASEDENNVIASLTMMEYDKGELVRQCTIPAWALEKINEIHSKSIHESLL